MKSSRKNIITDWTDTAKCLRAEDLPYDASNSIKDAIEQVSTVSAGAGLVFYPDDTEIIGKGTDNDNELNTLDKVPTGGGEDVDAIACATNTVLGEAYLFDIDLDVVKINAGVWAFHTYCSVSSVNAGRESYLTQNAHLVKVGTGTLTTTGTGTTRTATASSGTPFEATDDNADITLCGYIQTPKGLYAIPAYTSTTVVTITTPTTYVNESAVAYSVWKYQFSADTSLITNLTTDYQPKNTESVQAEITTIVTDKLGLIMFATSNNTTTVNYVHNGTENYSHFTSPLPIYHNDLTGLNVDDFRHISAAQKIIATTQADTDNSGYLSDTDWDTFNDKAPTDASTFTTSLALTSGDITTGNGNFVVGTSGKGIDFSATSDYGGNSATGWIASDGTIPADADTVLIDSKTYTFKTALTPTEGEVLINGSAENALINLKAAINHTGTPDTDYSCAAVHPTVSGDGITATSLAVSAKTAGTAGNSISLVVSDANMSVSASTLDGGSEGMSAEILNDYEEGAFTPSITFGGAAVGVTYYPRAGRYTKIGRAVNFSLYMSLSAKGSSTGNILISGLPYVSATGNPASQCAVMTSYAATTTITVAEVAVASATLKLFSLVNEAPRAIWTDSEVTGFFTLFCSGTYMV